MKIRALNQSDLDVEELESRIELLVVVPNEDICWSHGCSCNSVCSAHVDVPGCTRVE